MSLFGHNFWFWAPTCKRIIFPISYSFFLSSKKVSRNHNINLDHRYLPKIPFVHRMDNGPLGLSQIPKMVRLKVRIKVDQGTSTFWMCEALEVNP